MGSLARPKIQKIAIIGGGPSGICTAKALLAEKLFSEIRIFEQSGNPQGAWNYHDLGGQDHVDVPQLDAYQPVPTPQNTTDDNATFTTPMYTKLETNIPQHLMVFRSKPFPKGTSLFPPRQIVSQYIEEYADDVRHLIHFNTQVQDLHLIENASQNSWHIKTCNLITGQETEESFDAVAMCTGHYDVPFIPDVSGIREFNEAYPGIIKHSKFYRKSRDYTGKKVVVVGNSASGVDIANQIAEFSKRPLIISARSVSWLNGSNSASEESRLLTAPQIVEYLPSGQYNRAVKFADGTIVEDIDTILYCTGYLYSFPFLSSFLKDILGDGTRVHNIYQYILHQTHPSLAFVGLPIRVIPFPLAEIQAATIAKVWTGQLKLPSLQEMQNWQQRTESELGAGKKFMILDNLKDMVYLNGLIDWMATVGSTSIKRWDKKDFWLRSKVPAIKKAYADRGQDRHKVMTIEELGFTYTEE